MTAQTPIASLPWLPPMAICDGDWTGIVHPNLYAVFHRDFKIGRPKFKAISVFWQNGMAPDGSGYEEAFWHLTTKEDSSGVRLPDFARCKRLPWCVPTILNHGDPAVKCWKYKEGGGAMRWYLWLENEDYVVIIEECSRKRGPIMMLITAYYVDGDSTRRSLTTKYQNRVA